MATFELHVQGMACGHCARAVTLAIQARDRTAQVAVTLESRMVRAETSLDRAAVVATIEAEGYRVMD